MGERRARRARWPQPPRGWNRKICRPFCESIIEVAGLLARGQRYRLLATPTDDRGAVNPLVLVRRALDNGDAPPLGADLTQALLRVDAEHPDCVAALALEEREAELPAAARIRLALTGAVQTG